MRGRWKIERQIAPGRRYTTLRTLPAGTGPQTAHLEFRESVRRACEPGATSRALRLKDPKGDDVEMVDVAAMRLAAAAEGRAAC